MFQMASVTGQASFDCLPICSSSCILPLESFQSAFETPLVAAAQSADHLTGICQVKPPADIIHTLADRKQLRLLVEFQLQFPGRKFTNLRQAAFRQFPNAMLLHIADMKATYLLDR